MVGLSNQKTILDCSPHPPTSPSINILEQICKRLCLRAQKRLRQFLGGRNGSLGINGTSMFHQET